MSISINCDMGEGFGLYRIGDDEALMPHITVANVACGFHASDPLIMANTVRLAKRHGVGVGAHPSLPDRQGFGRREMAMEPDELEACLVYQVGALKAFLDAERMPLSHVKPHGALYAMAARDARTAEAVGRAARTFGVPVMGLAGTRHEEVYGALDVPFIAEFFADLEYGEDGRLLITRTHEAVDPEEAAARVRRAAQDGVVRAIDGTDVPVRVETVCVHSDTPGAAAIAQAVRAAVEALAAPRSSAHQA